jgi:hypothetical protein
MADWVTISSLATAGGTLVLAVATFSSVKSANRSARVAELSLLAGVRPVLVPSREDDPVERVGFRDGRVLMVAGHGAAIELADESIYMAMALRNGGNGLAVIHGWRVQFADRSETLADATSPALDDFRQQLRDLYIPAGETGFWQGGIYDRGDGARDAIRAWIESGDRLLIDILYGDYEGGQRTIARFSILANDGPDGYRADVIRYWNVDRADPR